MMTPDERQQIIAEMAGAMRQAIGPTADLIRATMAAEVDGLIDARQKFAQAGWPEWMIVELMKVLVGGNVPAPKGDPK